MFRIAKEHVVYLDVEVHQLIVPRFWSSSANR